MSLLWLRFALACYFIGLVYAFVALSRTSDLFSRIALHAASLGMVFHFVSLTELFLSGHVVWASVHNGESLLAFLSMSFFMLIYAIYQTTSPGVVVFPVVFFLTFVAALDEQPVLLTQFVSHKGWLVAHIFLIFIGYAALLVSFGASLLYLLQERRLKAKKSTQPDFISASAGGDRPDRLPIAAPRFSVHDARPAHRLGGGDHRPTAILIFFDPKILLSV